MKVSLIVLLGLLVCTLSQDPVILKADTDFTPALKQSLAQGDLAKLNSLRALHGVGSVIISSTLTAAAQAYADNLCSTGVFAHSAEARSGQYGENLYYTAAYPSISYDSGKATANWYSEISNYDFATGTAIDSSKQIGHFTAEIWKTVTTVGFGYCLTSYDYVYSTTITLKVAKLYVVANYSPTPNYIGQYVANVPAPI